MEYGQVVTLLFVALLGYYVFLIVTDLQKAKAAQMAEQENHMEEDIDISDEAQSFQPKRWDERRRKGRAAERPEGISRCRFSAESCIHIRPRPSGKPPGKNGRT